MYNVEKCYYKRLRRKEKRDKSVKAGDPLWFVNLQREMKKCEERAPSPQFFRQKKWCQKEQEVRIFLLVNSRCSIM